MQFRHVNESDYIPVISVIDSWWGGRKMADMLPKLFFQHFQQTSFIVEQDSEVIGFLIGFISQTYPNQAYIHFIGVHPEQRGNHIASRLYDLFFNKVRGLGCDTVRCITSPVNQASIEFHTRMGFQIEQGDRLEEGIPVTMNYNGRGQDMVLFVKELR